MEPRFQVQPMPQEEHSRREGIAAQCPSRVQPLGPGKEQGRHSAEEHASPWDNHWQLGPVISLGTAVPSGPHKAITVHHRSWGHKSRCTAPLPHRRNVFLVGQHPGRKQAGQVHSPGIGVTFREPPNTLPRMEMTRSRPTCFTFSACRGTRPSITRYKKCEGTAVRTWRSLSQSPTIQSTPHRTTNVFPVSP